MGTIPTFLTIMHVGCLDCPGKQVIYMVKYLLHFGWAFVCF